MNTSSGSGDRSRLAQRLLKREKRRVIGASTERRRKNGRRRSSSRVVSSSMSVKTQCSCHRFVTKSRSESTSGKVKPRVPLSSVTEGKKRLMYSSFCCTSAVEFDLDGRCNLRKPWCCTRYSAVVCLPEQIVPHIPISMICLQSRLQRKE